MIRQALDGHRNHFSADVISPGAADFLRLEGIVLGAVAVNHFDVAATLLGPETMGRDLMGEQ